MPSPFPGMNPYLEHEDVWHDFHERFLPHIAEVIGSQPTVDYIVKIDEHIFFHEPPAERRTFLGRGDVFVATQDLQTALHHVYDAARYETYIYESTPQPALNASDDSWARRIIDPL